MATPYLLRFPLGPLPEANIVILSYARDNPNKKGAYRFCYNIEYKCCGKQTTIGHETIKRRVAMHIQNCRVCVRAGITIKKKGKGHTAVKKPYGVVPPEWPVPA